MANIVFFTLGRELDANGVTVPGAKATFFEAGTTTPITAYSDAAASVPHPSPLEADAGGLFAPVYVTTATAKVVITKSDGSTLRTIDPCPIVSLSGVGASGVAFTPTVDIPKTNVQDAIEAAAASAASGFAAFGLGVTGNAPTLVNIDATNIGVGQYRTTASTTGTFPIGITASSTSIVRMERETSALGVMTMLDDSGRVWQRFMIASAWGAWREIPTFAQGPATGDLCYWNGSAWTRLAIGTTGQVFTVASGVPAWAGHHVEHATVTTTSGTAASFTSIPSWVSRIEIILQAVSASGTNYLGLRVGHSGGTYLTTGYEAGGGEYNDAGGTDTIGATDRFLFNGDASLAAKRLSGILTLTKYGSTWTASGSGMVTTSTGSTTPNMWAAGGFVSMGANTLDSVRLLWSGADTFDNGTVAMKYS